MPVTQSPEPDRATLVQPDDERVVARLYFVDTGQPMPGAGGGLPAFAATDLSRRRTGLMAIQCRPDAPARALPLAMLPGTPLEGVLCPVAHGVAQGPDGRPTVFTICQAPPGPAVCTAGGVQPPWSEAELLAMLLRPAAAALDRMLQRHLTHRAIRCDNLFSARSGAGVVLGTAWSGPPGCGQPALYETPHSAMCHPAGRGEGSIADDTYALGVVMVTLALGREPLAGLSDASVIRRKLELGSFAAIVGDARLPPAIADLARGMLADDPDQRPLPALLADPAAARARRVASRPPRRAQRVLEIGRIPVWTGRTLAYAVSRNPELGLRHLRDGSIDRWVRRSLADPALAVKLEEAMRQSGADTDDRKRADRMLALRVITLLDPLAPLSWGGATLWPDGIGPMLAATDAASQALHGSLCDLIESEAWVAWAALRSDRVDLMAARTEAHAQLTMLRQRGWGGGLDRLRYALNPLLACTSPVLGDHIVVALSDLLPALDNVAANPGRPASGPVDRQVGAFLAARQEHQAAAQLLAMADTDETVAALAQLSQFARLQTRLHQPPLPNVAAWLADRLAPLLTILQNQPAREAALASLADQVRQGDLAALLALVDNAGRQRDDAAAADAARQAVEAIDAELRRLEGAGEQRIASARLAGQEFALSLGYVFLALLVMAAVLA